MTLQAIKWGNGKLEVLDQILLPAISKYGAINGIEDGWKVINKMQQSMDEVDNQDYRMEEVRLRSFTTWPVSFLNPATMAAAGFYYTGEGDMVRCFECKLEICQWVEGDNPMANHKRWQERCRFIRKMACGNVPIRENPNSVPQPRQRGHDVCGPYNVECRPGSTLDCHFQSTEFSLPSTAKLCSFGIGQPTKGPTNPEYASYDARLQTFRSWPKCMPQTKESLADAGFYYTGKSDQTLCYYCGGGLKDWEPNDDPWEQHAKWFSECYYLLMVKGQAYVNTVTGQTIALPSNEESMPMNLPSDIKKVESKENSDAQKDGKKSCNAGPSGESGSPVEAVWKAPIDQQEKATIVPKSEASRTSSEKSVKYPIQDSRICKICCSDEIGIVFLPCGHILACVKCAVGMVTCALCRQSVSMTVRAYIS